MPKQAAAPSKGARKTRPAAKKSARPAANVTAPPARTPRPAMRDTLAVKRYLEAIAPKALKPGMQRASKVRDPEWLRTRIANCDAVLNNGAKPMEKLEAAQLKIDLEQELRLAESGAVDDVEMTGLRDGFVESAARYAKRQGISYLAFRKIGVPRDVLKAAGISVGGVEPKPLPDELQPA